MNEKEASPFCQLTTNEVARGVSEGRFKASDVMEQTILKAKEINQRLNCVTQFLTAEATKKAKHIDELIQIGHKFDLKEYPLLGVPISIKDMIDVKGYSTVAGFKSKLKNLSKEDALVVERLKKAGAIVFCKTNIPQFGLSIESSNLIYGATSNHFNTDYTAGGSSGGEAALLAAQGSFLGVGSDIGGSLRIPSHFSGLYTLKPGSSRLSSKGMIKLVPGQNTIKPTMGPMSRTLDDLELFFQICVGSPKDNVSNLDPNISSKAWIPYPINYKLRIGYYISDGALAPTPPIQRAMKFTIDKLKATGHEVFEFMPTNIYKAAILAIRLIGADSYKTLLSNLDKGEKIDPTIKRLVSAAKLNNTVKKLLIKIFKFLGQDHLADNVSTNIKISVKQLYQFIAQKDKLVEEVYDKWTSTRDQFGNLMDCLICPVTSLPAHPKGEFYKVTSSIRYSIIYNLLDFPSGTIPVTSVNPELDQALDNEWFKENNVDLKSWPNKWHYSVYDPVKMKGLPIGIQVVTKRNEEEKLVSIMKIVDHIVKH